ncbi:MAG TPA: 50S ribosomal protein L15 [Balneolales bacterium]|nr:50S ribosomal protein L15 [Balneolales bacterium]
MKLENLTAPVPNRKTRKRVGRGEGSGLGKQSGRGHKGQKAGSGYSKTFGFEGGQMPLQRRIPKFGFINPFRKEYIPVNLDRIEKAVEDGKLGETITVEDLVNAGMVDKNSLVKILGKGDLKQSLTITAHAFSKTAEEKISQAGGKVNKIEK